MSHEEAGSGRNDVGRVARGLRDGDGLMRWADGSEFSGGWKEGAEEGHGVKVPD